MDYSITSEESFWRGGVNLQVALNFTAEEHVTIAQHSMDRVIIVPRDETTEEYVDADGKSKKRPFDNNLRFSSFYPGHILNLGVSSWHADSSVEGQIFAQQLDEGFKRFKKLLDANAKPPDPIHEDFTPVEFDLSLVPFRNWFEHTYILGESGGGKSQLIEALFLAHRKSERAPGFVIMDSQNVMLPLIKRKFANAILIDPIVDPPYINPFDVKVSFNDHAGIFRLMETFRYLFEAGEEPLTGRQRTVFERGVALMLLGYPEAFGRPATIEDFEDFFTGSRDKRARVLSENAKKAAHELPPEQWKWYENEYPLYDDACNQVLQRLNNLCGQFSPLRPLFSRGKRLDLTEELNRGGIVLINTNVNYLQERGSVFFGRYFFKLIEQQMQSRTQASHPLFFVIDEAQEYFDNALMAKFLDQSRKRNVACVFAHQRLSQLRSKPGLFESLTGVAVRFGTNFNDHDIESAMRIWRAPSAEFLAAQQREFAEKPSYADYALYVRGWKSPQSVRVAFYQVENLPNAEQPRRAPPPPPPPPPGGDRQDQQRAQPPPPPEPEFEPRVNDIVWEITISPKLARDGGNKEITLPSKRKVSVVIKAGTKNGTLVRFQKEAFNGGNLYIKINVPPWPEKSKERTWDPRGKAGDSDEHTAWG